MGVLTTSLNQIQYWSSFTENIFLDKDSSNFFATTWQRDVLMLFCWACSLTSRQQAAHPGSYYKLENQLTISNETCPNNQNDTFVTEKRRQKEKQGKEP